MGRISGAARRSGRIPEKNEKRAVEIQQHPLQPIHNRAGSAARGRRGRAGEGPHRDEAYEGQLFLDTEIYCCRF